MEDTLIDTGEQVDQQTQDGQPPKKKVSVQAFAAQIKAKYPEYKDIEDGLLTKKIIEKYGNNICRNNKE